MIKIGNSVLSLVMKYSVTSLNWFTVLLVESYQNEDEAYTSNWIKTMPSISGIG